MDTMQKYMYNSMHTENLYDVANSAVRMNVNGSSGDCFRTTGGVTQEYLISPYFSRRIMFDELDKMVSKDGRNIPYLRLPMTMTFFLMTCRN